VYERVLVPTDGSDAATAAAEHAVDIAATYGATLHVLYVVDVRMSPISSGMDREAVVDLLSQADEQPTAPVRSLAAAASVPVVEAVRLGVPAETIRSYVTATDCDLVVMGTHGRTGLAHALLGSLRERVLRTVDVPVLTVRGSSNEPPGDE
jgi:nucleotide-binding universal stress UspA family protein